RPEGRGKAEEGRQENKVIEFSACKNRIVLPNNTGINGTQTGSAHTRAERGKGVEWIKSKIAEKSSENCYSCHIPTSSSHDVVNIPGKDLEVVYMMPAHNYHAGRIITNNQCGICLVGKAYEIEGRENAWVAAYHQQVIPLFDSQQVLSSNPSLPLYAQAQKNPLTGDCPNSDVPAALTVMVSGFNSALEIHIPLLPIVILNSNEAVVNS
ncbi:uncharacterized protein BO96DRAFT_338115, partial [Aspergillus niger CBS 101883]|uniref:uncharacterized protein n=1 Tax=Aspergillus lacticoffeatus (strain CBS 101883) TaxID=1450533 RepID=UPI000D7F9C5E